MMTPAWILDTFAAFMLAVAAVSAARLAATRLGRRGAATADADITHLLMAVAMAGMLAASLNFLPDAAWEVIFGLMTAWFAWQTWRGARDSGIRAVAGGHCAPHLVHSGAMLYMYLALPAPSGGSGGAGMMMGTMAYPTLAFVLAIALLGYSAWDLDQLPGSWRGPASAGASPVPARRLAMAAAEIAAAISAQQAAGEPSIMDAPPVTAAEDVSRPLPGSGPLARVLLSPGMMAGCRIVMGVTMALMLIVMI